MAVLLLLNTVTAAAASAREPHIVFMIGEDGYRTWETLPAFAESDLIPLGYRLTIVHADKNTFPGLIEALRDADLLFISVRRRTLPADQLAAVRAHLDAGRPLVGLRTTCHAFTLRPRDNPAEATLAVWQDFDPEVLGGHYTDHHRPGPRVRVTLAPGVERHPILAGVDAGSLATGSALYKVSPLREGTTPLLLGAIPGQPAEPLAWTHRYGPRQGRIFFTSLGAVEDFEHADFRRLLVNGIAWALELDPGRGDGTTSQSSAARELGPDGVAQIYPTVRGGTEWFLDMANPYSDANGQSFNISYGTGSRLPFTTHEATGSDPKYFNTRGSVVTYNSGNPPGRSTRLDVYPAGGRFANESTYSWRDNPGYLYRPPSEESGIFPGGIRSREFTVYIRPHRSLGTHQSFSFKVAGRDPASLRSAIVMRYPTSERPAFRVIYNYEHFPYVSDDKNVKTHFQPPVLADNVWVGAKLVQKVSADRKTSHLEMWVDNDPFDATGRPKNNWRLATEYEDRGPPKSYLPRVAATWACHKDVLRIDGFDNIDFTLLSDRAIDPAARPQIPTAPATASTSP